MELTLASNGVIPKEEVITEISTGNFIEANTKQVTLEHLKNDTIIPVFSKDNECTISHNEFIGATQKALKEVIPIYNQLEPNIRISHTIKGRISSAIGKPVKELLPNEKTIYYERMAFMIEIPGIREKVNGNFLNLVVGGVRAYNQENLYSKKTIEKFKVFIGFKNQVCTNLCISTDGLLEELRVSDIVQLQEKIQLLFSGYNQEKHLGNMECISKYELTEIQFAHLIGKLKMYNFENAEVKRDLIPIELNDGQLNNIIKEYYQNEHFSRSKENTINLWNLYNLFTGANKSSYIDNHLERNVSAFELSQYIANKLQNEENDWLVYN